MPITSQPTQSTGDTIEAAYSNTNRDNVALLDARTGGDPGATGSVLKASGALSGVWGQIVTAEIADDAITAAKIADGNVVSAHIANGQVQTVNIGNLQVTTEKLADAAVDGFKLATGAVTNSHLQDLTIATGKIGDSQITSAKIADGTIQTADIADSQITSAKIADGTIVAGDIANGNVTAAKLSSGAGTNGQVLSTDGTNLTWAAQSALSVGNATQAANAALLDNLDSSQFARVDAATNFTTAPTISSTPIARIATGSYSGNSSGPRQITTGFACKLVRIQSTSSISLYEVQSTSQGVRIGAGTLDIVADVKLHASNGFIVGADAGEANVSGIDYIWTAFG